MSDVSNLHQLLLSIGGPNVYHQVPDGMTIKYPAIKYSMNKIENKHANNIVYNQDTSYTITIMSKNVDEPIIEKISKLPKCSYDRGFIQDGIYHNIFILYY